MKWLILIMGVLTNASASVLVKIAMTPLRKLYSPAEPLALLTNGPFWLGLALYGSAFLLYAAALARLPLNVAHPVLTCGAVAAVAVFSVVIFKEPFSLAKLTGILLVVAGVSLITLKAA